MKKNNPLPSLLVNTLELKKGFNLPSKNNNNNSLLEKLNPNITALVNILTGLNLIGKYFSREGSFVKLIEFIKIEIENSNKWLKKFN